MYVNYNEIFSNYYAVSVYVAYLVTFSNSETLQDSFGITIWKETRKKGFSFSWSLKNQICVRSTLKIVTTNNTTFRRKLLRRNFFLIIFWLFSHSISNRVGVILNCSTILYHSKFPNLTSTFEAKVKGIL